MEASRSAARGGCIMPPPLRPGDRVAIVCPASWVRPEYIEGAARCLERMGYVPVTDPQTTAAPCGSYSAPADVRAAALRRAWADPSVRAVLCGRGGYGCTHIMDAMTDAEIRDGAKWLIGFSDISALHARLQAAGVASLHAPMCRHLAERGEDHEVTRLMQALLSGSVPQLSYIAPASQANVPGTAGGTLRGGNFAVLEGLAGTRWDMSCMEDTVLFVEDVAEPIYKIERMLWRLHHAGLLEASRPGALRGLVTGQFTGWQPDRDHRSMEEMTARFIAAARPTVPLATGLSFGHVERNLPLVEGARATLRTGPGGTMLTMHLAQ